MVEQHKYWRYVAPVRSYFDWLPLKIATAFCSTALEAFAGRQYGELEHLEEMENPRFASMYFQNFRVDFTLLQVSILHDQH